MRSALVGFVSDLARRVVAKAMSGLRGAGDWLFGVRPVSLRLHPRHHRCMPQQELPRDWHPSCRVFPVCSMATQVHRTQRESVRVTFMVKHCFISLTTSSRCALEPTTTQSSTCTTMNTLRARSTRSDVCASECAKPSRDVSTCAK